MKDIILVPADLGRAVHHARKTGRLKATAIAAHSGRARHVLHRLERGEDVTVASALDILRAMGLTLRQLDVQNADEAAGQLLKQSVYAFRCLRGDDPHQAALSLVMPATRPTYQDGDLFPVMDQNLPEGDLYRRLRSLFPKQALTPMHLLALIGANGIGRLGFGLPGGAPVPPARTLSRATLLATACTPAFFDELPDGSRLGFEDIAALMCLRVRDTQSDRMYQGSYQRVAELLQALRLPASSLQHLFDQAAFTAAVRNGDGHLKNFGVLYTGAADARLAPMFDVVTTASTVTGASMAGLNWKTARWRSSCLPARARPAPNRPRRACWTSAAASAGWRNPPRCCSASPRPRAKPWRRHEWMSAFRENRCRRWPKPGNRT